MTFDHVLNSNTSVPFRKLPLNLKRSTPIKIYDHWMSKNSSNFWKCRKPNYGKKLAADTPINGSFSRAVAEYSSVHFPTIYNSATQSPDNNLLKLDGHRNNFLVDLESV